MSDPSEPSIDQPPLLPPPKPRNKWKTAAIVLGVIVGLVIVLFIIGVLSGDDRDEKLAKILPTSIEKNFRDNGIDVTVTSVSCEDLPTTDGSFSIECEVSVAEIEEVIEATVQGSVDKDLIQIEDVSSKERLLTPEMAIPYVQGLVDEITSGVTVLDCDLGGDVVVIDTGSDFSCTLDSDETVVVTVAGDGSASISDVISGSGS